jgi:chaperonin GroES
MSKRVLNKNELPVAPLGERILLLPDPPDELTDGGLHIPEIAQSRPFAGRVVAAGLKALDKLYDNETRIGDRCWWGKFAGVIEEWDHIVEDGKEACDAHSWERAPSPGDRIAAYSCRACSAVRWAEPLIVANVDDLLCNIDLADRLRSGAVDYVRAKLGDGFTQHVVDRHDGEAPSATGMDNGQVSIAPPTQYDGPRPVFTEKPQFAPEVE